MLKPANNISVITCVLAVTGVKDFKVLLAAVADPGFPRGGGANSPGGAPTYDFAKFPQKLHEIERIWTPRGARIQNFTM